EPLPAQRSAAQRQPARQSEPRTALWCAHSPGLSVQGTGHAQRALPHAWRQEHRAAHRRTAEGLARLRAARTRHGGYSAEARAFERSCRVLIRDTRVLLALAERPAENRPALDPDALHDALLPQAMLPSGPALPPSKQTDGKSPYAVRTALLDSPSGPGDLASSGLEFGPITALRPPHPTRQDPVRRERQPLRRPPAPRF